MLHSTITSTLVLSLSLLSAASPINWFSVRDTAVTEAQMLAIAPSSNSCADAPAAGECATASTAAKYFSQSLQTYKVTSKAEQAAIISLMAFESDEFKYNKNHFPGTPGQGSEYSIQPPSPRLPIVLLFEAFQGCPWPLTRVAGTSPSIQNKN